MRWKTASSHELNSYASRMLQAIAQTFKKGEGKSLTAVCVCNLLIKDAFDIKAAISTITKVKQSLINTNNEIPDILSKEGFVERRLRSVGHSA